MLPAWRERGLCTPGAGRESGNARQHRGSPGSVSPWRIRVMDLSPLASARARARCSTAGSSHSLPTSPEPPAAGKQSLFSGEVCWDGEFTAAWNVFPLETPRRYLPSHSVERRRGARTRLEEPYLMQSVQHSLGSSSLLLFRGVGNSSMGLLPKLLFVFSSGWGLLCFWQCCAIGTSLPQSDFFQTLQLLMWQRGYFIGDIVYE